MAGGLAVNPVKLSTTEYTQWQQVSNTSYVRGTDRGSTRERQTDVNSLLPCGFASRRRDHFANQVRSTDNSALFLRVSLLLRAGGSLLAPTGLGAKIQLRYRRQRAIWC
jgi:hypothetical protein